MEKLKRIRKWSCQLEQHSPKETQNIDDEKLTSFLTESHQHLLQNWMKKEKIRNCNKTLKRTLPYGTCYTGENILCCNGNKIRQNNTSNKVQTCKSISRRYYTSCFSKNNWNSRTDNHYLANCNFFFFPKTFSMSQFWLVFSIVIVTVCSFLNVANALETQMGSTVPMNSKSLNSTETSATSTILPEIYQLNSSTSANLKKSKYFPNFHKIWKTSSYENAGDSIFLRFAKRFTGGNVLWDGIIKDCYKHPTFSCFQKNVYIYLNDALDVNDVNVTQRLKFYKNNINFEETPETTEANAAKDSESEETDSNEKNEHLLRNEIPNLGRSAAANTPIEEVTNALYGKSVKFAMTHDLEIKLPEMMFDGATFRISPRSIEGNGIIAKLELIPKQEVQARLAGKIIMKKIQKFLRSKLLLSFLALLLIIKIIKIKLFWLLPLVIGVGAAKKLLLKFLLFLFPALSHLFKLCSYYQQTYHSTKYHHHHHLINHHHTIVPQWNAPEHSVPEIIYTNPPKGHVSTYLHGAPIHETYGPPLHEHYEGGWENSGPGLGSEYISDINRAAELDDRTKLFKPNPNDGNEINAWGLGVTQSSAQKLQRISPAIQSNRPPTIQQKPQQIQTTHSIPQQPQFYKKPHATSHTFNPFASPENQSHYNVKYKNPHVAQSAPSPVYVPPQNQQTLRPNGMGQGLAAQIASQYDPSRNIQKPGQQNIQHPNTPEVSAQVKEAIRIQTEQRLVAQQQKILENQPFVQDGGQPLMPKNYDPFYSPILLKIDKIIEQLGIKDDLCKERVVCSMYKDPQRYSPHSNFISAELSRDTSELQPAANTNEAVLRFYRLIQAARDGQDQRDCLTLYPQCNINTE